ncbi:hypothetical protein LTR91_008055 [Friedmanniomyces endolithicus]|uniref:Major facilitator superfamily (MFS) profile domain-containing protein n=1 Tax=Friedmanniomyces endolithicus TaxID=329885 RepID=A0AAN6J6X3_9PEZI|nr:hypothetical protein LTR35_003398 [Friedmanniomyces endolithicus]KAK0293193.1 hypothetical protein LTS00_007796 [Friedmanniomyces endolithicus]KAK0319528.1 hypothetical protein LTR82_009595 [Friedmanniomyces endolithicus]KAK0930195.1 hypothetical protein LTR57_001363 [Friedmanniomyces endolithicus]KAK0984857.1 hypothetical protein LTR54_013977 [Friedmanniomyces endolithicus]
MSVLLEPFTWFYHAFGLVSIQDTGPNAYLIILARACRMFAYGTNSLILALFFAELQFSDYRIGLFMTLTLLGDVFLGLGLTLIADRYGRRKILFGGSFLMVLSGATFAVFENFWILLFAAVVGVVSATGGDFGPFRAIEESILSQLTTPRTRSDVLAWYVTTSTVGSAIGSEVSGRIIHALQSRDGWELVDAYHALFWIYTAMGIVNALLVLLLTDACEMQASDKGYAQVAQEERESLELEAHQRPGAHQRPNGVVVDPPTTSRLKRMWSRLSSQLAQISAPTRAVMYKLWALLAVDSIADGMVPYSLTNYYMNKMFHPAKSTLGDVTAAAYFLGAVSSVFAGPLAHRIGLINTMVFTHIPSSAAVLVFGLPNNFVVIAILLMIRAGLNNMDQAPRSAFIAAVVKPEERTAVMGITNLLRTFAAMAGPSLTGVLAGNDKFWMAFLAAGAFRLAYDVGLYVMFVNMQLYKHEGGTGADVSPTPLEGRRSVEEEDMVELHRLSTPDSSADEEMIQELDVDKH